LNQAIWPEAISNLHDLIEKGVMKEEAEFVLKEILVE
jgi:hypothetical protein